MGWKTAVLAIATCLVAACGGGGGGGGAGPGSNNPPAQQSALVPTGVPVLYVTSILQVGGSADEVVTTIRQFVPDTGESILIDVNESFSFGRSSAGVFTFDDRLILLRNSGTSGGSGATWTVLDTDADVDKTSGGELQPALLTLNTSQGNPTPHCVAASGTRLYWRNAGAALVAAALTNSGAAVESELFASGSPNDCFGEIFSLDGLNRAIGGLDFADGTLYDAAYDSASGQMDFYERDPVTGEPTLLTGLAPTDHPSYNPGYSVSFDNGRAYFARVDSSSGQLEIWSFDFVNPPQLLLATVISNLASVSGLDVDDGYFVVRLLEQGASAFDSTRVLLFDSTTMSVTIIDLLDVNPATPGLLPPTFEAVRIMFKQP